MAWGDIAGDCVTNPNAPRAQGVCDYGGEWVQRHKLRKQLQWNGTAMVWTGQLVCDRHYDKPQPQLRTIQLPPDPLPVSDPRPESFNSINRPIGLTTYVMWPDGQPLNYGVVLMDGSGEPILDNLGQEILIEIGYDGIALLAQLSEMTGIPVPGNIQSYNSTITTQQVAQQLVPALANRSYIAIFNPCQAPIAVSFGTAAIGVAPSLNIGAGGCLFWATAQGYGAVNPAVMTVVAEFPNVPYYVYQSAG